jgi:hypothetical protein
MNKYRNMKKTILTLIAAIALSMSLYEANAQNVQLHYDMGRGCTTSTVEMFKADDGGSTFFFVDMDYGPKVSGAYWEIARELNFWQDSKVSWLSVHVEYNGGLSTSAGSFNNSWLGGLTYSGHSQDWSKTWPLRHHTRQSPAQQASTEADNLITSSSQEYGISTSSTIGFHSTASLTSGARQDHGRAQNTSS